MKALGIFLLIVSGLAACAAGEQSSDKKANRLVHEKSPYLLQHAYNPVDWYPWGDEAFALARSENKVIFLSVGYSTCYWCHVMEREVFENEEIAALMNRYFVNIKVDREERPDVDRIYMTALQGMTGSGGWPMSLFLTPDREPFFGRSYVPPEPFRNLIERIQEAWAADSSKIRGAGRQITEQLKKNSLMEGGDAEIELSILKEGFERFRASYDEENSGFGSRPKFPRPSSLNFLLRYHHRTREEKALEMTLETLRRMRAGGIYDHLGGGFHRYSVDARWRVPHFEKMLYDQAQLIDTYLDAYRITQSGELARTARETLQYVLREMTHPEGAFYSAEDAESAPDAGRPAEKKEGAFYVWSRDEVIGVLGEEQGEIFCSVFGVTVKGNALEDPHQVFTGKNILYLALTPAQAAKSFGRSEEEISGSLESSRRKLMEMRRSRARPHLDDKILTAWNGLMISACARAYQVLGDAEYLRAAGRAADFVFRKLRREADGRLLRRYRDGEARFEGTLDDYAFFTKGLLDLYESSFEPVWLRRAVDLTRTQNSLFYDREKGGFFDTSGTDASLLFRTKDDYDGAEPAGNSIAVWNLLRLAEMTDNGEWRKMAHKTLATFYERVRRNPESMPQLLVALDFHLDKPKQIVIAGPRQREDVLRMLLEVRRKFLPNKVVLLADGGEGQEFLGGLVPFLKEVRMRDNKATAYVCEDYACKLPTTDLTVLARQLDGHTPE